MRQRRAKIYRKMLHSYSMQFGFREPWQLLIDDTFTQALSRYRISDPLNQFSNVLQSKKIKPLITQCSMQSLYALGKEHQSTIDMAKGWERRMCNHREAIEPKDCIKECVGENNKHRYVVASENSELRKQLREEVPGVVLMHFTQAVMVLEPMSELTKAKIAEKEDTKLSLPASEAGLLRNQPSVQVDIVGGETETKEGEAADGQAVKKEEGSGRKRKRKAPNPLSMRKPKNPRLTMEEKLKRDQEFKKQKQRDAARLKNAAGKPKEEGEGGVRKRRRHNKGGSSSAAQNGSAEKKQKQEPTAAESKGNGTKAPSEGEAQPRKRRSRSRPSTGKSDAAAVEASLAAIEA